MTGTGNQEVKVGSGIDDEATESDCTPPGSPAAPPAPQFFVSNQSHDAEVASQAANRSIAAGPSQAVSAAPVPDQEHSKHTALKLLALAQQARAQEPVITPQGQVPRPAALPASNPAQKIAPGAQAPEHRAVAPQRLVQQKQPRPPSKAMVAAATQAVKSTAAPKRASKAAATNNGVKKKTPNRRIRHLAPPLPTAQPMQAAGAATPRTDAGQWHKVSESGAAGAAVRAVHAANAAQRPLNAAMLSSRAPQDARAQFEAPRAGAQGHTSPQQVPGKQEGNPQASKASNQQPQQQPGQHSNTQSTAQPVSWQNDKDKEKNAPKKNRVHASQAGRLWQGKVPKFVKSGIVPPDPREFASPNAVDLTLRDLKMSNGSLGTDVSARRKKGPGVAGARAASGAGGLGGLGGFTVKREGERQGAGGAAPAVDAAVQPSAVPGALLREELPSMAAELAELVARDRQRSAAQTAAAAAAAAAATATAELPAGQQQQLAAPAAQKAAQQAQQKAAAATSAPQWQIPLFQASQPVSGTVASHTRTATTASLPIASNSSLQAQAPTPQEPSAAPLNHPSYNPPSTAKPPLPSSPSAYMHNASAKPPMHAATRTPAPRLSISPPPHAQAETHMHAAHARSPAQSPSPSFRQAGAAAGAAGGASTAAAVAVQSATPASTFSVSQVDGQQMNVQYRTKKFSMAPEELLRIQQGIAAPAPALAAAPHSEALAPAAAAAATSAAAPSAAAAAPAGADTHAWRVLENDARKLLERLQQALPPAALAQMDLHRASGAHVSTDGRVGSRSGSGSHSVSEQGGQPQVWPPVSVNALLDSAQRAVSPTAVDAGVDPAIAAVVQAAQQQKASAAAAVGSGGGGSAPASALTMPHSAQLSPRSTPPTPPAQASAPSPSTLSEDAAAEVLLSLKQPHPTDAPKPPTPITRRTSKSSTPPPPTDAQTPTQNTTRFNTTRFNSLLAAALGSTRSSPAPVATQHAQHAQRESSTQHAACRAQDDEATESDIDIEPNNGTTEPQTANAVPKPPAISATSDIEKGLKALITTPADPRITSSTPSLPSEGVIGMDVRKIPPKAASAGATQINMFGPASAANNSFLASAALEVRAVKQREAVIRDLDVEGAPLPAGVQRVTAIRGQAAVMALAILRDQAALSAQRAGGDSAAASGSAATAAAPTVAAAAAAASAAPAVAAASSSGAAGAPTAHGSAAAPSIQTPAQTASNCRNSSFLTALPAAAGTTEGTYGNVQFTGKPEHLKDEELTALHNMPGSTRHTGLLAQALAGWGFNIAVPGPPASAAAAGAALAAAAAATSGAASSSQQAQKQAADWDALQPPDIARSAFIRDISSKHWNNFRPPSPKHPSAGPLSFCVTTGVPDPDASALEASLEHHLHNHAYHASPAAPLVDSASLQVPVATTPVATTHDACAKESSVNTSRGAKQRSEDVAGCDRNPMHENSARAKRTEAGRGASPSCCSNGAPDANFDFAPEGLVWPPVALPRLEWSESATQSYGNSTATLPSIANLGSSLRNDMSISSKVPAAAPLSKEVSLRTAPEAPMPQLPPVATSAPPVAALHLTEAAASTTRKMAIQLDTSASGNAAQLTPVPTLADTPVATSACPPVCTADAPPLPPKNRQQNPRRGSPQKSDTTVHEDTDTDIQQQKNRKNLQAQCTNKRKLAQLQPSIHDKQDAMHGSHAPEQLSRNPSYTNKTKHGHTHAHAAPVDTAQGGTAPVDTSAHACGAAVQKRTYADFPHKPPLHACAYASTSGSAPEAVATPDNAQNTQNSASGAMHASMPQAAIPPDPRPMHAQHASPTAAALQSENLHGLSQLHPHANDPNDHAVQNWSELHASGHVSGPPTTPPSQPAAATGQMHSTQPSTEPSRSPAATADASATRKRPRSMHAAHESTIPSTLREAESASKRIRDDQAELAAAGLRQISQLLTNVQVPSNSGNSGDVMNAVHAHAHAERATTNHQGAPPAVQAQQMAGPFQDPGSEAMNGAHALPMAAGTAAASAAANPTPTITPTPNAAPMTGQPPWQSTASLPHQQKLQHNELGANAVAAATAAATAAPAAAAAARAAAPLGGAAVVRGVMEGPSLPPVAESVTVQAAAPVPGGPSDGQVGSKRRHFRVAAWDEAAVIDLGAAWDPYVDAWFTEDEEVAQCMSARFQEILGAIPRAFFIIPNAEARIARNLGALWDSGHRLWYTDNESTRTSLKVHWKEVPSPQAGQGLPPAAPAPDAVPS